MLKLFKIKLKIMAKENIAFLVNLRKNTVEGSDMYGRYYPEAETRETLSTKGFAKHVSASFFWRRGLSCSTWRRTTSTGAP